MEETYADLQRRADDQAIAIKGLTGALAETRGELETMRLLYLEAIIATAKVRDTGR